MPKRLCCWLLAITICATALHNVHADGLLCAARDTVARLDIPGTGIDITLDDDLAFIAGLDRGLLIVDIHDPRSPRLVGEFVTSTYVSRVAADGPLALIADSSPYSIKIIDVANPAAPSLHVTVEVSGFVSDLAIDNQIGYFTTGSGLHILSLADPANPTELGLFEMPAPANGFRISNGIAYIADDSAGLQIVDVSNPQQPQLLSTHPTVNAADDVELLGGLAFLVDAGHALTVLDVSNPASPSLLADLPTTSAQGSISIDGQLACIGGHTIISIADPMNPVPVGSYPIGGAAALRNGFEFLARSDLQVRDISNPPQSGLLGTFPTDNETLGVDIQMPYAFLADTTGGMQILDISNPEAPVHVSTFETGSYVHDVVVNNNVAYIADAYSGFHIVDVTDPANPTLLALLPDVSLTSTLDVANGVACLTRTGGGLYVVDVSNPADPSLLYRHHFGGNRSQGDVAINAGFAVVAHGDLRVFDLSTPTDPPVTIIDLSWSATAVRIQNSHAYIAGSGRLAVFDISTPQNPIELGLISFNSPSPVRGIDVAGTHVFLALSDSDVLAVDVANPATPSLLTGARNWLQESRPFDVKLNDDKAYIVSLPDGLQILDISDCPCPADYNHDNTVDTRDIIAFSTDWAAQRGTDCHNSTCSADITGDNLVDSRDFLAFLNLWNAGC